VTTVAQDEPQFDLELLREESVEDLVESAEAVTTSAPLSYFGTDFDVHGLVRRLNEKEILVPNFDPDVPTGSSVEGFQRRFVWQKFRMDRFVESLLLEYPLPGIFLVRQPDKKMLVLNGSSYPCASASPVGQSSAPRAARSRKPREPGAGP
jgi:hypothetical protein